MDTKVLDLESGRRRRRHSAEFRAEAVAASRAPGMSMAAVALARGLNANLLRRWVIEAEGAARPAAKLPVMRSFVPVEISKTSPAITSDPPIRIQLRQGSTEVTINHSSCGVCGVATRVAALIRVDEVWMATEPLDMAASTSGSNPVTQTGSDPAARAGRCRPSPAQRRATTQG